MSMTAKIHIINDRNKPDKSLPYLLTIVNGEKINAQRWNWNVVRISMHFCAFKWRIYRNIAQNLCGFVVCRCLWLTLLLQQCCICFVLFDDFLVCSFVRWHLEINSGAHKPISVIHHSYVFVRVGTSFEQWFGWHKTHNKERKHHLITFNSNHNQ